MNQWMEAVMKKARKTRKIMRKYQRKKRKKKYGIYKESSKCLRAESKAKALLIRR